MKKSVYFVLASVVAAILWLIARWLLPDVFGAGALLILLAAANAPLLVPRLRMVELPSGVKLHFSPHEEESERQSVHSLKSRKKDSKRQFKARDGREE